MTRAARSLRRDDAGATTVVFAVVVLLLFAFAALGVELTSMYARDRAVQTVADVTALSAAQDLPDACAALATAVRTLSAEANAVPDDDGNAVFGVTGGAGDGREPTAAERAALATQLSDRDLANGEVQVLEHVGVLGGDDVRVDPPVDPDDPAWLSTAGCSTYPVTTAAPSTVGPARFVRVVVPSRTVRFTFANAFSGFGDGSAPAAAEVRAVATAGIRAPEGASILPVALAGSCLGRTAVLTTDAETEPGALRPAGSAAGPAVAEVVVGSGQGGEVPAGFVGDLRVGVSGLVGDPAEAPETVVLDLHDESRAVRVELRPTAVTDVVVLPPPEPSVEPSVEPSGAATAEPSGAVSVEPSAVAAPAAGSTLRVAAAGLRPGGTTGLGVAVLPAPAAGPGPSVEPSTGPGTPGAGPDPTEPEPTDPGPTATSPAPTGPTGPTSPDPTQPDPSEPEPSGPEPSQPEPSEPEPSEPEPSEPEPTEPPGPSTFSATFVVRVDERVTGTSGTWTVRARQPGPEGLWTPDTAVGTFTVAGDGTCGEVGLLSATSTGDPSGSGVDLAQGLLDGLTSFPAGVLATPAPASAQPCDGLPGALAAPLPGARCVGVAVESSAGRLTRGLVTGVPGSEGGRLAPEDGYVTATACPAGGGTVPVRSTPAGPVVGSTLSCYLAEGVSLADVVLDGSGDADLLLPEIYEDPRFFFLPVLNGGTLPTDDGSYAVAELRGAFVTGERVDADGATTSGGCPSDDSCDGLEFSGDELYSVQLLTFPATALPSQLPEPTDDRFYPAGTKEVVLVE